MSLTLVDSDKDKKGVEKIYFDAQTSSSIFT